MAELGNYRVDAVLCSEGIWCLYDADIEFKIARITTPKYQNYMQKLNQDTTGSVGGSRIARSKRRRAAISGEDDQTIIDMVDLAMSHHILMDWKNLQIDGVDIEHSQEKAFEILQNEEFQDVRSFVLEMSSDAALFLKESIEEAAGN